MLGTGRGLRLEDHWGGEVDAEWMSDWDLVFSDPSTAAAAAEVEAVSPVAPDVPPASLEGQRWGPGARREV